MKLANDPPLKEMEVVGGAEALTTTAKKEADGDLNRGVLAGPGTPSTGEAN